MGVSVCIWLLFLCQVTFVKSQLTATFISWACELPHTDKELLPISFSVNENPKREISPIQSDNVSKTFKLNPIGAQELQRLKMLEAKYFEKKSMLPLYSAPTIGLTAMPTLQATQKSLSIHNSNMNFEPRVSSLPIIELADLNNFPLQPSMVIPTIELPCLNSTPVSKHTKCFDLKSTSVPTYMKTLPTGTFIINGNVKDTREITRDYNAGNNHIPVFTTTSPLTDSKPFEPLTLNFNPQIQLLQCYTNEGNKAKEEIISLLGDPKNVKENFVTAHSDNLQTAVNKVSRGDTPILINNMLHPPSNLLYNTVPNINNYLVKENSTPHNKNNQAIFSEHVPIVDRGCSTAAIPQSYDRSYEFKDDNNFITSTQPLSIPQYLSAVAIPSVMSYSENQPREIETPATLQSNKPSQVRPIIPSTYTEPETVPPKTTYKTSSNQYTEHLSNSLDELTKAITKNVIAAFLEKTSSNKSMETLIAPPRTKSCDVPSNVYSQGTLPMPVFDLSPPPVESPARLQGPKLDLQRKNTSSTKMSDKSTDEVNRSSASSQPYIASITVNVMPSKETAHNIVIVI